MVRHLFWTTKKHGSQRRNHKRTARLFMWPSENVFRPCENVLYLAFSSIDVREEKLRNTSSQEQRKVACQSIYPILLLGGCVSRLFPDVPPLCCL